jgi:two-component system sensor histidine kinase CpxA
MRGLLIKIFLWFWLALALIATVLVLSLVTFENGPVFAATRALVRNTMTAYGRQAITVYERDGTAAVMVFVNDLENLLGIEAELFDAQRHSLTGRTKWPGDDDMNGLIEKAMQQQSSAYRVTLRMTSLAVPLRSNQGSYCFAAKLPPGFRQNWQTDRQAFWFRVLIALLTAAAVCYGLSRYLTRPIVQLQQATRRIAAGDLTARVSPHFEQRRDEIADLAQDFNRMADRVATARESQHRLLGDISHELRSPLTRLNIALALARQQIGKAAGELAQPELDRIEREAERLNEMIGQLLALARTESEVEKTAYEPMQLDQLMRDIVADADFEARSQQRSVVMTQAHQAAMIGPPALLRSAIENVVRNAVRYTAPQTQVRIELIRMADQFVICVRDHGSGVPEESLEKLFLPFYRVSVARDRESGGTGLGLAITARTVNLLGGSVSARNMSDGGLCVELRLPA